MNNTDWEKRCYNFIKNDYSNAFKSLLKTRVVDKIYKSGKIKILDYGFDGSFVTQGVDKKDMWISLSNKTILTYDLKFDKRSQITKNIFLPFVSNPQENKVGWALDNGRKIIYVCIETKNKNYRNKDNPIPIGIINIYEIIITNEFIKYFSKNEIYEVRTPSYEQCGRTNDGKVADSLGRIVPRKHINDYEYFSEKPEIYKKTFSKNCGNLNEWI